MQQSAGSDFSQHFVIATPHDARANDGVQPGVGHAAGSARPPGDDATLPLHGFETSPIGSPSPHRRRLSTPGSRPANAPAAALPEVPAMPASSSSTGLTQDMAAMQLPTPGRHFCPVPGCPKAIGGRYQGWETDGQGLRAHVDAHLLGQLPGLPPEPWMSRRGMVVCRLCGRMVSRRCNNGIHRTCLARELVRQPPQMAQAQDTMDTGDELPSLTDICKARIETREFIGVGLLPIVEREFNKCTANVVAYSRVDAWDYVNTERDTPDHQRARAAWIEWFMFAKTVLLVLPGGKAKDKRNDNILANRAARWAEGERRSLWDEALHLAKADIPRSGKRKHRKSAEEESAEKREQVIDIARRGLPGKAVQHASSAGLAPDTRETEEIMRSKFVQPPAAQAASRRMPAPEANHITEESTVKAIRSFHVGVSAGPSGQRPDLYRQLIGDKGDKPAAALLTSLANLLASGRAPAELRKYIGGAKGTALRKHAKDGSEDARPACSGETIRRVIGKVLLGSEIDTLCAHLLPHQLAVGVKAGVEAMPHLARQWRQDNAQDPDKILINFDEGNAHNEVDRHTFLTRMRELVPGICTWLEYIYPTDAPTFVFYRGRIIESRSGGQQGCPLIGACHAVVKRMVHESLGLLEPVAHSSVQLPRIQQALDLDLAPLFADDGIIAGRSSEVLRALQHMKLVMPLVGLRFSFLQVAAANTDMQPAERFALFTAEGCTAALDGNIEVLKSPIGEDAWCRAYAMRVVKKQRDVLTFLAELGDSQVSHYLLRWCVNGSRMNYLVRTTPPSVTAEAAAAFDYEVEEAFMASSKVAPAAQHRARIGFSPKDSGVGVMLVADRADAAYVASRAATHKLCRDIRPEHRGEASNRDEDLRAAVESLSGKLRDPNILDGDPGEVTQTVLNDEINRFQKDKWMAEAEPAQKVWMNAYSAPGCGQELGLTPSKTLDTQLSQGEFATCVACRLGVDVMEGNVPCPFCGELMDSTGIHALSCMSAGDATSMHNGVRDVYHDYCERGGLRPRNEAPQVLAEILGRDNRRRPADVLCIPALALAQRLPDGSRAVRTEPVCFDFAVINALGRGHWADTAAAPGRAAERYDTSKRTHRDTERLCREAGYRFWPVVHEIQGGMAKAADAATRAISEAVAEREGRDTASVRQEFLSRIAVLVARCSARAIRKRAVRSRTVARPFFTALTQTLHEHEAIDMDE